jgi:hypothetical protein
MRALRVPEALDRQRRESRRAPDRLGTVALEGRFHVILASWGTWQCDIEKEPWLCVTAGRWTLQADADRVGFFEQRQFKSDGRWDDCGEYYGVWKSNRPWWELSFHAGQYDGYHQTLYVGPFQICWCHSFSEPLWREKLAELRRAARSIEATLSLFLAEVS